jgi:hypothetical protein
VTASGVARRLLRSEASRASGAPFLFDAPANPGETRSERCTPPASLRGSSYPARPSSSRSRSHRVSRCPRTAPPPAPCHPHPESQSSPPPWQAQPLRRRHPLRSRCSVR